MRDSFRVFISTIVVVWLLVVGGCKPTVEEGNVIVNIPQPTEEAVSLTSQGWVAFEQNNYERALVLFQQATGKNNLYADAFNGIGWTYARLDSMQQAIQFFDIAIGLNFSFIDAYAGRSFVSLALGEYKNAIAAVNVVQNLGPPFYTFRHDTKISMNDLLLVKAQSSFFLHDYVTAQQIINTLDPDNALDTSSPRYLEDLALEIEVLWGKV